MSIVAVEEAEGTAAPRTPTHPVQATAADPITVDPTRPDLWPVMTEEEASEAVTHDMRVIDHVPASWWGEKHEVLVATHDLAVAVRTADELALRDLRTSYAELVGRAVTVDGPHRAVLVGWAGSGHVEWRPADDSAPYVLFVCRVRPARAQLTLTAAGGGDLDVFLAAEDSAEDGGLLARADRRTCRTCGAWATTEHVTGSAHLAALVAEGERATAQDSGESAPTPASGEGVA